MPETPAPTPTPTPTSAQASDLHLILAAIAGGFLALVVASGGSYLLNHLRWVPTPKPAPVVPTPAPTPTPPPAPAPKPFPSTQYRAKRSASDHG